MRSALNAILIFFTLLYLPQPAAAAAPIAPSAGCLSGAEAAYASAREQQHASNDEHTTCELARCCFELGEYLSEPERKRALAKEAICACREYLKVAPQSGCAHYWLALNLGALARSVKGMHMVPEILAELKKAEQLDPSVNFGGPDRSLGLLYEKAPTWPISVGNRHKAREHLTHAATLFPDFPENRLDLLEAYSLWNEQQSFNLEVKTLSIMWNDIQTKYSETRWDCKWPGWTQRWEKVCGNCKL